MGTKDRFQNPVIGDTVRLMLLVMNSNNTAALSLVDKVEIYYLDPTAHTIPNPDGRTLIETVSGASVLNPTLGTYEVDEFIDPALFTQTGNYLDLWYVQYTLADPISTISQYFTLYPDLWATSPTPIVYDFSFGFSPHKLRLGENKEIEIEIIPNVPRASDLEKYYQNLAISADLSVSIAKRCTDCPPSCDSDLDLIVDGAPTDYRERNRAFYRIDTNQYDPGIYDIWFTLNFGTNTYMSENFQFMIWQ